MSFSYFQEHKCIARGLFPIKEHTLFGIARALHAHQWPSDQETQNVLPFGHWDVHMTQVGPMTVLFGTYPLKMWAFNQCDVKVGVLMASHLLCEVTLVKR